MVDDLNPYEALLLAVEILVTQAELARVCKVSPTAVWKWVQSSKRVPPEHVIAVADATGIPPYILRPDIYPRDYLHSRRWLGIDQRALRTQLNGRAPRILGIDLARANRS